MQFIESEGSLTSIINTLPRLLSARDKLYILNLTLSSGFPTRKLIIFFSKYTCPFFSRLSQLPPFDWYVIFSLHPLPKYASILCLYLFSGSGFNKFKGIKYF